MNRKWLLYLLCLLFCCGCEKEVVKVNPDPLHEYGDSMSDMGKHGEAIWTLHAMICDEVELNDASEALVKKQKKQFLEMVKQSDEPSQMHIDWNSYLKDDRYVSLVYTTTKVTGNKQSERKETLHYDVRRGAFFTLEDVVSDKTFSHITTLVKQQLSKRYPEQSNSVSFQIGMNENSKLFESFAMKKDGLTFYFNANELYSFPVELSLSYEEIGELEKESVTAFVPYEDVLNEPVRHIDPNRPMIAISFDDGPNVRYTSAILDVLQEEQACATFFILASRANIAPDLLQRMVLEGNEIGNHTLSHKQLTTLSKEQVQKEIRESQDVLFNITGKKPVLLRPPYGSHNQTVDECMKQEGLTFVSWSVDTQDWLSRDAQKITSHVLNRVRDGDIVLMHDMYPSTVEALKAIIASLKEQNYQFVTISELLEYRNMPIAHG